jgi:Fic-DOC domain mobile mystery protein B
VTDPLAEPADATPLADDERRGLRLPVLTRAELNQVEAENIGAAMAWLFLSQRRLQPAAVIREEWLKRLHWRMYSRVWSWAGDYRMSDRNLGVPFWLIRPEMRNLEADAAAWLAHLGDAVPATATDAGAARDEIAVRFGHRLVSVHPFPNGNGRWSRLASDALIVALGGRRFTWGGASLTEASRARRDYIAALQTADVESDYRPLAAFARS